MQIIRNYNNINDCYLFDSGIDGPTSSIFSGIHGDEISGIKALKGLLSDLQNGKIILKKGKLIIVDGANNIAIAANKRYIKTNLNRLFIDNLEGGGYEYERSRELISILKESNYLLDLHSTPGPSIPFLFAEKKCFEVASRLGISHIIVGWNSLGSTATAGDTENYLNNIGGIGLTFEAGNHDNPDGEKNSTMVINNFLITLGYIDGELYSISDYKQFMNLDYVYAAKSDNFRFIIDDFTNFRRIDAGTLIGIDGEEEVYTDRDAYFIMPKLAKPKIGEDVFFIGSEIAE